MARMSFEYSDHGYSRVDVDVPAGPRPLLAPSTLKLKGTTTLSNGVKITISERLLSTLTCLLQAHALGWDISLIPPMQPSTASCSTSILVRLFGDLLGYEVEDLHLYKELGGRELVMRRQIETGGATTWRLRYPRLPLEVSVFNANTLNLFQPPHSRCLGRQTCPSIWYRHNRGNRWFIVTFDSRS